MRSLSERLAGGLGWFRLRRQWWENSWALRGFGCEQLVPEHASNGDDEAIAETSLS
jgi:hypothetical protein